ncbi:bifunctional DNA polymerase epsilon [Babesia duncani]|uniref:DNA polymerase epsilon catalytic subunit n=1 Tax=Babesia duncani TaxID=323732 RepID=A0AAD9PKX9_9APIC|nr:bifunctional DNA polymerase epsilon [Babesia duncani]
MAGGKSALVWTSNGTKSGFLYNVQPTTINSQSNPQESKSALNLCFISEDSSTWTTAVPYSPYFYLSCVSREGVDLLIHFLQTKFTEQSISKFHLEAIERLDLILPNHLAKVGVSEANCRCLVKLTFDTIDQLERAKTSIQSIKRLYNREKQLHVGGSEDSNHAVHTMHVHENYLLRQYQKDAQSQFKGEMEIDATLLESEGVHALDPAMAYIGEIYEHDVRYLTRVCIDLGIRCGTWYKVDRIGQNVVLTRLDKQSQAPFNIFAWDIECYKEPLKFPNVETDEIILISIMFNGQGYLITNRNIISSDIYEFSYNPNRELSGAGPFKIFNKASEEELLKTFFELISQLRPHIFVTYNGDNFDFPYVHRRAEINKIAMEKKIGIYKNANGVYSNALTLNMDCYKWVERDSYLPFGSRTLKQVCKIKLEYNPVEIDPEDMVPLALSNPQKLAVYSVSDAVITYYLYMKFIHNFVLALCFILPLQPNDVLRQGSGTLCENLLMAEAYNSGILFPNKHTAKGIEYYFDQNTERQHLIYDNSYVGARVESLRCGLYRDDLKEKFKLDPLAYQQLLDELDETLLFWASKNLKIEMPLDGTLDVFDKFENFDQIYSEIKTQLEQLRDSPILETCPRIYHLDVGAMYPNIIISQRLQPTAIVNEQFCQSCAYYKEANQCQKRMQWKQKLDISPADKSSILPLIQDLKTRSYKGTGQIQYTGEDNEDSESQDEDPSILPNLLHSKNNTRGWQELSEREREAEIFKVVKAYCQKVHKKTKVTKEVNVESIVCQRENPFYVQTVQKFRDLRYVYKRLKKEGETTLKELQRAPTHDAVKHREAMDKILINDSLQMAHKCILNSFYGYVKRGGSRWYSMEMGAIVTNAGAAIIDAARQWIESIGIPIELDTDGIWCMVPDLFPAVKELVYKPQYGGKSVELEYMTTVLNQQCAKRWSNNQYMELEECGTYRTICRNEIEFELDGPWHAMFLPASDKSEDHLKKRYVVFNHQGKIVELKGFEIKRRSEMRMIQLFQEQVFPKFLEGTTKEEAYASATKVAQVYCFMLDSKANELDDDAMFELLAAKKTVKRPVIETPLFKCFGITTARRLAQLFNNEDYIKDGNLSLSFLLAGLPADAARTARALPLQVFQVEPSVAAPHLAKWLRVQLFTALNSPIRDFLDWSYYREKLDTQILKLICIPAILQGLENPCKNMGVQLPSWLVKKHNEALPQVKITSFFSSQSTMERLGSSQLPTASSTVDTVLFSPNPPIEIDNDSSLWGLKRKWLLRIDGFRRYQRRNERRMNPDLYSELRRKIKDSVPSPKVTLDLEDLYTLSTETWHVCDYSMPRDGILECLVSIHGKMQFLKVEIELWRYIYVHATSSNACVTNENLNVTLLDQGYMLPRGAKQFHLFRLEMLEGYFEAKVKNYIGTLFNQGVYEAKIPIHLDFVARIGNVCNTGNKCILNNKLQFMSKGLVPKMSIQSLEIKYCDDIIPCFVYIFQGHATDSKRRNRLFAAVYTKHPDLANRIFVASTPGLFKIGIQDFNEANNELQSQYVNGYAPNEASFEDTQFPKAFGTEYIPDLEANSHASIRQVLKRLDTFMTNLKPSRSQRKFLVMLYSTLDLGEVSKWAQGSEYPVFHLEVKPEHYNINASRYMRNCLDISFKLLQEHCNFLNERMALAQIGSVPLLPLLRMQDSRVYKHIYDMLYMRALRHQSGILWASSERVPDFGIFYNECNLDADVDALERDLEIACPGIYRGYGAKISLGQTLFCQALVTESRQLVDVKQSTRADPKLHIQQRVYEGIPEASRAIVESKTWSRDIELEARVLTSAPVHPLAFKILGCMLDNLIKHGERMQQRFHTKAYQTILTITNHLLSWLCDPSSLMYDPALYSRALLSAQRYLASLLHFMGHEAGLLAIYANVTSIVVDAGVATIGNGRAKVLQALKLLGGSQSKFKNLSLAIEQEYVAMVQVDARVFIRFKSYTNAQGTDVEENLRVLEYLPIGVEKFARYILKTLALAPLWRVLSGYFQSVDGDLQNRLETPTSSRVNMELLEQIKARVVHEWIHPGVYFSKIQDLFDNVESFMQAFGLDESHMRFPQMPASLVYPHGNWKHEVTQLFLFLLKIDKAPNWELQTHCAAYDEKAMILYSLAEIAQYPAGKFAYPARKLEVRKIECSACHNVNDLDLICDVEMHQDDMGIVTCAWSCKCCHETLDAKMVEWSLVLLIQDTFYAYHTQDLICSECKCVHKRINTSVCKCGRPLVQTRVKSALDDAMQAAREIQAIAKFETLRQCMDALSASIKK